MKEHPAIAQSVGSILRGQESKIGEAQFIIQRLKTLWSTLLLFMGSFGNGQVVDVFRKSA